MGKKETGLVVKSELLGTLDKINEKLKSLKALEASTNKTAGLFKWNPNDSVTTDIFAVTDVVTLVDIYAAILERRNSYENAVKALKLNEYPVWTWQGFTFEAWDADLKLRINLVSQDAVIKKLKADKDKLEQFLDKEDLLSAALEGMNY